MERLQSEDGWEDYEEQDVFTSAKHPDDAVTVKTPVPEPTPPLPERVSVQVALLEMIDALVAKRCTGNEVNLDDLQALQRLARG